MLQAYDFFQLFNVIVFVHNICCLIVDMQVLQLRRICQSHSGQVSAGAPAEALSSLQVGGTPDSGVSSSASRPSANLAVTSVRHLGQLAGRCWRC